VIGTKSSALLVLAGNRGKGANGNGLRHVVFGHGSPSADCKLR